MFQEKLFKLQNDCQSNRETYLIRVLSVSALLQIHSLRQKEAIKMILEIF